jgi:hypothetical protein
VAVADDRGEEYPERGGRRVGEGAGMFDAFQHQAERAVRELVKQVISRREVAVQGSDADAGFCGDRGHGNSKALPVHRSHGGACQALAVALGVASHLTRFGRAHRAY